MTTIPARRIKSLRDRLGMTQAQFASALGVARNTVARWEIELSRPRGLSLKALLDLYNMSPEPEYKVVVVDYFGTRVVDETNSLPKAKLAMNKWLHPKERWFRRVDKVLLVRCSIDSDEVIEEGIQARPQRAGTLQ